MSGLRSALSAMLKGLGLVFEAVNRSLTTLNDSSVAYNRSLKERLEAGRTPALETTAAVLEAQIACPDFFRFSKRQVAGKRKELLLAYEELAGRLTGEAAAEVLLKMQRLQALIDGKAAG
ncbi:MAG: hypothetical protein KJ989_09740 [Gammaproteobacteria bacterium]|nr:hypothetical protein [Gammaproteobacteria bacterium]MBU2157518.1 hypothetical protein [Gammaproteobacteria bacterium]MBU2253368.1 hypothetical protein [Gammaproteobacteria bacterium]MBU2294472.1 hypothetical protein [Gammaproteobacteria bacterium]